MKKTLLLLPAFCLILINFIQAQTAGSSCFYPVNLGGYDTCTPNNTAARTHNWYQFTSNNYNAVITLTSKNVSPGVYHKMILYSGYCGGLMIKLDSALLIPGDSVLTLTANNLQAGGNYYLEAEMIPYIPCIGCSPDSVVTSSICYQGQGNPGFCAFDLYNTNNSSNNPPYSIQQTAQDQYILNYISTHTAIAGPFTIPVVVHVIHNGDAYGTGVNITYEQIQWQIAALNAAFQRAYATYNQQTYGHQYTFVGYQDYSTNPQVRFCLATIGRDSALNQIPFYVNPANSNTESGVMRYDITQAPFNSVPNVTSLIEFNIDTPNVDEGILMDLTRPGTEFPVDMYMNIYLVGDMCSGTACNNVFDATPGIVGVGSMFPNTTTGFDGVVIRSDAFGDNTVTGNNFPLFPPLDQGKIADHEAGHYLALYHTFQPDDTLPIGCYGMQNANSANDDCDRHGDFCCDTPPDAIGVVNACAAINWRNSCNETYLPGPQINHPDMEENYMDYMDDDCYNTFTHDQSMRMSAMLDVGGPRHSLVTAANLILTGVSNTGPCSCCMLAANISPQSALTCPGSAVTFFTPSGVGLCATSWSWSFPGGSPSTGTGTTPSTTYASAGTYTVILVASDGNNSVTDSVTVTVVVPTVAITSVNTTLTVCDSTNQNLYLRFTGNLPPYSVTICNAANQVVATLTNIQADTAIALVMVNMNQNAFHICSAVNGLGCPLDTTGSGTWGFNVQECCPNLFVNGDFENWGPGCTIAPATTQELTSAGCATYSPSRYSIHNANAPYGLFPAVTGNNGSNGLSMFIDAFALPQMATPTPNHLDLWRDSVNIINGTTYSFQFDYSGNYGSFGGAQPASPSFNLVLQLKIDGVFVGNFIAVPSGSPWTPWHTFVVDYIPTIPTGRHQFTISQTNEPAVPGVHFSGGSFDYLLDNITLRSKNIPIADAGNDTLLCAGGCVPIGGLLDPNAVYLWSPSNGLACDTCASTIACPSTSTNYVLTVSENACVIFDTVSVNISNLNVSAGNNVSTCNGQPLTLTATVTGGSGTYNYNWMPGSFTTPNISVNPLSPTTYTVIVHDAITNCGDDTAMVTVTPGNLSVTLSNASNCIGTAVVLTPQIVGGIPTFTYLWLPGNQTTPTLGVFPSVPTIYTVIVTDGSGCSDTAQATVTPVSAPSVAASASPDPACIGSTVQLSTTVTGNGPFSYTWSPASGLSSTTISNPVISTFTGTPNSYSVVVVDANGCSGNASVSIQSDSLCCVGQINAPDTLNNITISAASMSVNTDLYITGTVNITGTDVKIYTGVTIHVLPGATLVINSAAHLHACQQMWYGISVAAGGTLQVLTNSLVEDAKYAVQTSISGISTVVLNQAIFNKNYIDVDIRPSTSVAAVSIINSRFTCRKLPVSPTVAVLTPAFLTSLATTNLIAPLATRITFTAINVLDVNQATIGAASANALNVMDNMEHGIYGFNSNVYSLNNWYQNMAGMNILCPPWPSPCPPAPGIAILLSDPTLDLSDATSFNEVQVGGAGLGRNYFVNCYQGVSINNYVKTTITNDTIFSGATVISPPNIMNLNGDHGIFVKTKYFEVMEINDNSVVNQETGIHLMLAAGGLLYPSAHIMHNKVAAQNTSTTFTTTGIFAEGVTGVVFAPYEYLFIDSNMVVNTATCIHARNFLKIGLRIDDNPLLRIRPITSATAGPNQAGILVQNCRISTVMRNSINSTGTTITNVNHRNVRGIYMINTPGSTVTCNQVLNTGQSLVFEGGCYSTKFAMNNFTNAYDGFVMRNSALIGGQRDANNPSDNQWIGTFTFSQTYVEFTSNINSPTLGSPLYTRSGGTWQPTNNQFLFPSIAYVPIIVNPGFTPADCSSEQLLNARIGNPDPDADETAQRQQIARDQINYAVYPDENAVMNQTNLQAELQHTPSLIDGDTVLQNFSFNNQNSSLGKMNEVEDELGQGNLTNASLANGAISPNTTSETNQQQYNSIYLGGLALSIDSLGPQQISDLFDIALQCPNEGGNAVFEARALLNWALNASLEFSDSCYSSARIGTGSVNSSPIAQVFPNPNEGNITLTYALGNVTTARFVVCDVTGQVLFSTPLDPTSSQKDLELSGIANGAYIYKLIGDNAVISSGTLLITR